MNEIRRFQVTTENSKEGVVYGYSKDGSFAGLNINEILSRSALVFILNNIKPSLDEFISWVKLKNFTVVELQQDISFEMFWNKYDDKLRSSKKKSLKAWNKFPEAEQVKAYYFIQTYNRHRGNAEKKYCETYLNAELWNN